MAILLNLVKNPAIQMPWENYMVSTVTHPIIQFHSGGELYKNYSASERGYISRPLKLMEIYENIQFFNSIVYFRQTFGPYHINYNYICHSIIVKCKSNTINKSSHSLCV